MNCKIKECPFIRSGECEVPPCGTCFLPCKEREIMIEPYGETVESRNRRFDDGATK